MLQRDAVRELDADLHAAFSASGLAAEAQYLPPGAELGAATSPCRVYVDRNAIKYGEFGQVVGSYTQITALRIDLTPSRNGLMLIDGEAYRLSDLVDEDDGVTKWVGLLQQSQGSVES